MVDLRKFASRLTRVFAEPSLPADLAGEIATTRDGRDITRPFVQELEQPREEIAHVGRIRRDMVLRARIEPRRVARDRRRDPLVLQPQAVPRGLVLVGLDRSVEHAPAPFVDEEAERQDSQMPKIGAGFSSYGPDPRSMACWAAARKCAGEPFTWPPPPNMTPLENTAEALEMNSDYNKPFVPTCTLD